MLKKTGFFLLVFFLFAAFALPLSLYAEMALCTDDELASVSGRAGLATFQVEHRNTLYDTSGTDRYFSHDVAVILLNMKISVFIDLDTLLLGYYNDNDSSHPWDIDIVGRSGNPIQVGASAATPLVLEGLRVELAFQDPNYGTSDGSVRGLTTDSSAQYNHMASANRKFIFFKIGSDKVSGGLYNLLVDTLSIDITARAIVLILPVELNLNKHRDTNAILDLSVVSGMTMGSSGTPYTDLYLAFSNTGLTKCPSPVAQTFDSIPGDGIWLHLSYVRADLL